MLHSVFGDMRFTMSKIVPVMPFALKDRLDVPADQGPLSFL